jgi:hypothetical protein
MKVLDADLDKNPTPVKVRDMAETRIRNLSCFRELQSLNDTGRFLYQHPLITRHSERSILERLFTTNPSEFLRQYKAVANNVKRYAGYIKKETRKESRTTDLALLKQYREKETLFIDIIQSNNERSR